MSEIKGLSRFIGGDMMTVGRGKQMEFGIPLLSGKIKLEVQDKEIYLSCGYSGCGSADSWPLSLN
jgi:hypothetical protein